MIGSGALEEKNDWASPEGCQVIGQGAAKVDTNQPESRGAQFDWLAGYLIGLGRLGTELHRWLLIIWTELQRYEDVKGQGWEFPAAETEANSHCGS